eukprot:6470378-Amphidinium_carterae.1
MIAKAYTVEACVLGQILFCMHSSARWSDVMALTGEYRLDDVLIEAEAKRTKISRGIKRLRVPVPYVAIATGVTDKPWANSWLVARATCQLGNDPSLPGCGADGHFTTKPMTSAEAARHLRGFLVEAGTPQLPRQDIGTHSLKTTLLAWAARHQVKASTRRILGKHSSRQDHTLLVYSRDTCIGALREVASMFACIRDGSFDPDASRALLASISLGSAAPAVREEPTAPATDCEEPRASSASTTE